MMFRVLLFVLPLTVSGFSVAATPARGDYGLERVARASRA